MVSKSELLAHVWDDPDEIADLNVVEVYVGTCDGRSTLRSAGGRADRPRCGVPAGGRRWLRRAAGERWRAARRPGRERDGPWPLVPRWWRRRGLRARVPCSPRRSAYVAFAAARPAAFQRAPGVTHPVGGRLARSGAAEVAALINANRLPDPVPVPADITIQVLSSAGDHERVPGRGPAGADRVRGPGAGARARWRARCRSRAPFDMPSLLRVVAVPANGGQLVIARRAASEASGSLSVVRADPGDLHAGALPRCSPGRSGW